MKTDAVTTSFNLPRATLALLRRAAAEQAIREGGRVSVSRLVVELVERNRAVLGQEMLGSKFRP